MTPIEVLVDEVCGEIRERAFKAARAYRESRRDNREDDFSSGYSLAYYGVVTLIQQTAQGLLIDPKVVHMDGVDADRDLL